MIKPFDVQMSAITLKGSKTLPSQDIHRKLFNLKYNLRSVSDLIIGLEGIPVYTYFFSNNQRWPFGAFLCDLWLSVDYSCCLASIYTVLGITADRYCSVKFPAAYRNWRTHSKVLLIIALVWVIPTVLFTISIFGYGLFTGTGRILGEEECYVQFMTNAYLNMGMYIGYYWSTLFLMLYLYYGIYCAAKQLASKSDQKQKRLALLSEMRKSKKDNTTTVTPLPVSEAPQTNSVPNSQHSQQHTSDTVCHEKPYVNNIVIVNSLNTHNGNLISGHIEEKSVSVDRPSLMPSAPSISEILETGAFQIDDDIPFIDEDSITSLCKPTLLHRVLSTKKNHYNSSNPIPPAPSTNSSSEFRVVTNSSVEKEAAHQEEHLGMRRLLTMMRQSRKRRKRSKATRGSQKNNNQSRSENRARKALRTITVILGTFTVFWTPFYVLATIYGFCDRCKNSDAFNLIYAISYYLCYMNSPINPFCYAMANQQFKRTFKRILRGDLRRT
uniref:G-protein coupled receptors family 1 profile domain-containing protein n=1 Tax=Acrobeloides nanus TaxID=290746 RepID=A0A914DTI0_9BILA